MLCSFSTKFIRVECFISPALKHLLYEEDSKLSHHCARLNCGFYKKKKCTWTLRNMRNIYQSCDERCSSDIQCHRSRNHTCQRYFKIVRCSDLWHGCSYSFFVHQQIEKYTAPHEVPDTHPLLFQLCYPYLHSTHLDFVFSTINTWLETNRNIQVLKFMVGKDTHSQTHLNTFQNPVLKQMKIQHVERKKE